EERLRAEGAGGLERDGDRLRFEDAEGMGLELAVVETDDEPLVAEHPEISSEHALQGFDSVRAYSRAPEASRRFLEEGLGFEPRGESEWEVRGEQRGGLYAYDPAPTESGRGGAGTAHTVAWAAPMDDHAAGRPRALAA